MKDKNVFILFLSSKMKSPLWEERCDMRDSIDRWMALCRQNRTADKILYFGVRQTEWVHMEASIVNSSFLSKHMFNFLAKFKILFF